MKKTWCRSSPASSGLWSSNTKRVIQRLVISKRNPQQVASPSTCRRRPLQKGFLSAGKLTDSATGIAVDEKQLISAGQERIGQKNEKDRHVSFEVKAASRKKQKMMHDVLQPTEIAFRRSSSVAHLYVRLDRGSKAWVNSQDLLPFA